MRVIEKEMNQALADRVSHWKKSNTEIFNNGSEAIIHLHGNHIATLKREGEVVVNLETVKQWPTNTTLSRLRALGVAANRSKGKIFIDGAEI